MPYGFISHEICDALRSRERRAKAERRRDIAEHKYQHRFMMSEFSWYAEYHSQGLVWEEGCRDDVR